VKNLIFIARKATPVHTAILMRLEADHLEKFSKLTFSPILNIFNRTEFTWAVKIRALNS